MRPVRSAKLFVLSIAAVAFSAALAAASLPDRLTDREFWKLSTELSEPDGTFPFDNLLSNEHGAPHVVRELMRSQKTAGVYLGVGPEQNFTYIAVLKPEMAFVVDIRRANRNVHLMYKALFELSSNRADFVSRLFSRERPRGLGADARVNEIFAAFTNVEAKEALYRSSLKTIKDHLLSKHEFPLSLKDLSEIDYAFSAFYRFGPGIHYRSTSGAPSSDSSPRYADLMTNDSYLGSEEAFEFLKDFQSRNLLVPVVGDFAGPKTIRAIGTHLKATNTLVATFYVSNVEQYLEQNGGWSRFCSNVMNLPFDETSRLLRAVPDSRERLTLTAGSMLLDLTLTTRSCRAN